MVDLDERTLEARGLSPSDVARAVQEQNVILPSGDVKIGSKDYTLATNSSPDVITAINQFPVGQVDGRIVFVHDVAHVHDGYQIQTNSVAVDGQPGAFMMVRKTGGVSTLAVIDGIKNALPYVEKLLPRGVNIKAIFDQSVFIKAALDSAIMAGAMAAGLTGLMILLFSWQLAFDADHSCFDPAFDRNGRGSALCGRPNFEHDHTRWIRPRHWHLGRQWHGRHREYRAPREAGAAVCSQGWRRLRRELPQASASLRCYLASFRRTLPRSLRG
jgi:hypothetical protein